MPIIQCHGRPARQSAMAIAKGIALPFGRGELVRPGDLVLHNLDGHGLVVER